uniref:Uncharacterized protein n=1 Tax=Arion vulgaris TaxID=1028688 RepID=A0A0B7AKB4_9EUPU
MKGRTLRLRMAPRSTGSKKITIANSLFWSTTAILAGGADLLYFMTPNCSSDDDGCVDDKTHIYWMFKIQTQRC